MAQAMRTSADCAQRVEFSIENCAKGCVSDLASLTSAERKHDTCEYPQRYRLGNLLRGQRERRQHRRIGVVGRSEHVTIRASGRRRGVSVAVVIEAQD